MHGGLQRTGLILLSCIAVHISLLDLPLHIWIVTELALVAFLASPSLIKRTKDCLGIHTKWNLLRLYRFQECSFLLSTLLLLGFLFFSKGLFPFPLESLTGFAGGFLLFLDGGDLFLDLGRPVFLLLHRW